LILSSGIIIVAATNRPDVLDSALMRPGRFDRQVRVDRPDYAGRLQILNVHAKDKTLSKDDDLGDPLVSTEHILAFKWMEKDELNLINKELSRINDFLQGMFRGVGIKLVDFKVEFGRYEKNGKKEIILADEISPDTCRLWDVNSDKKLDKDRFRKGLGNLIEAYQEVARRLDILHEQSNIRPLKYTKPQAVKIKKK